VTNPVLLPARDSIVRDVHRALEEDIGSGDVTADLLPAEARARARVIAREVAVLCGSAWFDECFRQLDPDARIEWLASDGERTVAGAPLCRIEGNARALVSAERSALNFLQTLSATATTTAAYVEAARGTRTAILDTRKTLPGLRLAQKYAVRCGGGMNHRIGLFDAVLIKENHIAAAGSIHAAVTRARLLHPGVLVETEVENFSDCARRSLPASTASCSTNSSCTNCRRQSPKSAAGCPWKSPVRCRWSACARSRKPASTTSRWAR